MATQKRLQGVYSVIAGRPSEKPFARKQFRLMAVGTVNLTSFARNFNLEWIQANDLQELLLRRNPGNCNEWQEQNCNNKSGHLYRQIWINSSTDRGCH